MKVNNQNQYIRHIAALQNPSPVVSSEDASNSGSDLWKIPPTKLALIVLVILYKLVVYTQPNHETNCFVIPIHVLILY